MPILNAATENLPLWAFAVRTVIMFVFLVAAVRVMGLREVAQLSPFDFAVAVTIGSIAATPLGRSNSSLVDALISVAAFAGLEVLLALIGLRSRPLANLLTGTPTILIADSRIIERNMRRTRVNNEELLSLLRIQNVPDPADVEFAVLEPNGRLSVVKRSQVEPATPRDLGLPTPYRGLPTVLVDDGEVKDDALAGTGLTRAWLLAELKKRGLLPQGVLLAVLNSEGFLYVQEKSAPRRRREGHGR